MFLRSIIMSNIDDIKNWQNGLPIVSHWNVVGFDTKSQVDMIKSGFRFLPSIGLPHNPVASNPKTLKAVDDMKECWDYLKVNQLPFCFKYGNICNNQLYIRQTPPLNIDNMPKSPLEWRYSVSTSGDKILDERGVVDYLGPISNWEADANILSSTPYIKKIKEYTNPSYTIFLENNEGSYSTWKNFSTASRDTNEYGIINRTYKNKTELEQISLRFANIVDTLDPNPLKYLDEFYKIRRSQYKAWFAKFAENYGPIISTAYKAIDFYNNVPFTSLGYAPEAASYDAVSPSVYSLQNWFNNFAGTQLFNIFGFIPMWKYMEANNPESYRELSLFISDSGAIFGKENNLHEVITPTLYEAYSQFLLWAMHEPGIPVMLRHYTDYQTKPSSLSFDLETRTKYPELSSVTYHDYTLASCRAVNTICEHDILRKFWLNGKNVVTGKFPEIRNSTEKFPYILDGMQDNRWRLLECNLNTPTADLLVYPSKGVKGGYNPQAQIKVWAMAIQLEDQILVFAWSPCKLDGQMTLFVPNFGTITVDVPQHSCYYLLTKECEKVVVTIEPKTIERLI